MNILFLDAYYEPETIAYTHLEKDLIEGLIADGHKIHIICPTPTRGISDEEKNKYKRIRKEKKYNGKVTIERFWAPQEGKNPILRAFRYFWCNLRTYQRAVKHRNIDVVFCNSTPPTQGFIAGIITKKICKKTNKKIRLIFNLQDIFPDSLVNSKMIKKGSALWKIGRKIENYIYISADQIVTISDSFKQNLVQKGVETSKITVIPNWIDTNKVHPVSRSENRLFDNLHLDRDKIYICYSGNIGHSQNLDLLLDVADSLRSQDKDISFVIFGEGAAKPYLEQRIKDLMLENIKLFPYQPYDEISSVFSLGTVDLIISKPGIGGSSIPSKTWGIMAAGRPILASFDEESELSKLIRIVGCGYTVKAGDKEQLLEAISVLSEENLGFMGEKGRRYVEENLDKTICIERFLSVFQEKCE